MLHLGLELTRRPAGITLGKHRLTRSGAARGPEKKFAKRGFAGKSDGDKRDGERRPYAGKRGFREEANAGPG